MAGEPLISVIDDDESVRESLPDLLKEFGFASDTFSSARQFLDSNTIRHTRCLLLDISMPGMTGRDLQKELNRSGQKVPIIFITADQDELVRKEVLALGAVECLFKPFSDTALLHALNSALRSS
jgi:FixJ family two-component response regulator